MKAEMYFQSVHMSRSPHYDDSVEAELNIVGPEAFGLFERIEKQARARNLNMGEYLRYLVLADTRARHDDVARPKGGSESTRGQREDGHEDGQQG
jgi:hypothetical protein